MRDAVFVLLAVVAAIPIGCGDDGSSGDGDSDADSDSDSDADSDTDSDADTDTDTDMDAGVDAGADAGVDTDTDTGTVVFTEELDGSSGVFSFTPFPWGDPDECLYTNSAISYNDGDEQLIRLACYDEGMLDADLFLPTGDYTISVTWSTGADPWEYYGPSYMWHLSAGGQQPLRVFAVNESSCWSSSGQKNYYTETAVIPYTGAIDTMQLAFGSAGGGSYYYTYYDRVEIVQH